MKLNTFLRVFVGRATALLLVGLALLQPASAQTITTLAGGGAGSGGPAVNAPVAANLGLAYDSAGNLFIADAGQNRIRRVDAVTGSITTVAGNGTFASTGNGGPALLASVGRPEGIALDSSGNIYVSDQVGNVVRRIDAVTGIISAFAGSGAIGFSGDGGPATSAALFEPSGLAVDDMDNVYVSDRINHRIRKVAAGTGIITTIAAENPALFEYYYNTSALDTSLGYVASLVWEPGGFLVFADAGWDLVRRINLAANSVGLVAGQTTTRSALDTGWQGAFPGLSDPQGVARNAAGELFIADSSNHRIRKYSGGILTTLAGNGAAGFAGDGGPASAALVNSPRGIAVDGAGNITFVDALNNRVRRIDALTGNISTIAGSGTSGSCCDNGPASGANIVAPSGTAVDASGNLLIAESGGHAIRRVDAATQVITTVAGSGVPGFSGDGGVPAAASLNSPGAVAVDGSGNVYIADTGNHRVRRIDIATGKIDTFAGNGSAAFAGDGGPAASASLSNPGGLAFDAAGNLVIADTGNDRVRKVNRLSGIITTIAGDGTGGAIGGDPENGINPYSGDGPATGVGLYAPTTLAFDASFNLYLVDSGYSRVHKIDAVSGLLSTVAGDGATVSAGDGGLATAASFRNPFGIALDAAGNLYISDRGRNSSSSGGHNIRRVDALTGIITTFAGTGAPNFSGDGGPASAAQLNSPLGLTRDVAGNLLIADSSNDRIRVIAAPSPAAQTITFDAQSDRAAANSPFALIATASSGLPVTFTSLTPTICTVSGNTGTLVGIGVCTITASQPGNAGFNAAPVVSRSFNSRPTYTASSPAGGNISLTWLGGGSSCNLAGFQFINLTGNAASPPTVPVGVPFPHGLFIYTLNGCQPGGTVTFNIAYPSAFPAGSQYYKYGPTASNPTPHWYVLLGAVISGAQVVFSVTDGNVGDDDMTANGTVVDPGGVGTGDAFIVTVNTGAHGSVTPPGTQLVAAGSTASFNVAPANGYMANVSGSCGGTLVGGIFTTNAITAACTVDVAFTATGGTVLVGAWSRKTHAAAGTFNLPIDTTAAIGGALTVEPRHGGNGHLLVFQFNQTVTQTGTVTVTTAAGDPVAATTQAVADELQVTLPVGLNALRVNVAIAGLNGTYTQTVAAAFLVGDVNGSRSVNASDVIAIKSRAGQTANAGNFRFDINTSGGIAATDILATKARPLSALP